MIVSSPLSTNSNQQALDIQRTCSFIQQQQLLQSISSYQLPTLDLLPSYSHNGLLSALPRSPTPAPTFASLIRCQLSTTFNTPSTPTTVVTTHNACRQLPSLPWPSPDQASATSSQMRASPWQLPKPLNLINRGHSRTHTRPNHDYGFFYQPPRCSIAEFQAWHSHV